MTIATVVRAISKRRFFSTMTFVVFSATLFIAIPTVAAIPSTINYHSRLRDSNGDPVTSATNISFALYTGATGGSAVWSESYNQTSGACTKITPDSEGYFSLELGSCSAITGVNFNNPVYLGVTIGADPEAIPRVKFNPAPYALNADAVDGLSASQTATANTLLALDGSLNFNINTGAFTGANLNLTDANAVATIAGTASIGSTQAASVALLTLQNTAGNFQFFQTAASPVGVLTGSVGDIAVDSTNGGLYFKSSGTSSTSGWSVVMTNDNIASNILSTPLTGFTVGANTTLADTDTLINAFGKLQGQLNAKQASITIGTTAQYVRGDLSLATFPTALSSFTNDNGFLTATTGDARYPLQNGTGATGTWSINISGNAATVTNGVYTTRSVTASGSGITGGGDLSANRTFSLDFAYLDARYQASGSFQPLEDQRLSTTDAPTFDALTLNGNLDIAGDIIPDADNTRSLGSPTRMWKDVYIGPGSLYINGQKVLQEDMSSDIVITADINQSLKVKASGTGDIELNPTGTGQIMLKGNTIVSAGKYIRTSDSSPLLFTDGTRNGNITVSGNAIAAVNTNGALELAANGTGNIYTTNGNFGVGDTSPVALFVVGSGDPFQVNSSGAIAAATGIVSSGTIRFSALGAGVIRANASGVLSSSALVSGDIPDLSGLYALVGGSNATGTWSISITGNAATVTNGVYVTGSYANPSWITSLAYSKITGAPTNLSDFTNDAGYISDINSFTTDDLAEGGTNKYFTTAAFENEFYGIFPSFSSGNQGQFLSVDGTGALVWSGVVVPTFPTQTGGDAGKALIADGMGGYTLGSEAFDGNRATTRSGIAGITAGGSTIKDFLENFFFPVNIYGPSSGISCTSGSCTQSREAGDSTTVGTISWSVTRGAPTGNSQTAITSISFGVSGGSCASCGTISPTGNSQSGSSTTNSASSANPGSSVSFSIYAQAANGATTSNSFSVNFYNRRAWGVSTTDITSFTDSDIKALSTELSTGRTQTRSFSPSGQYIYFAWPSSFDPGCKAVNTGGTPVGTVDCFATSLGNVTDFVVRDVSYTNGSYTGTYKVYRSGNLLTGGVTFIVN